MSSTLTTGLGSSLLGESGAGSRSSAHRRTRSLCVIRLAGTTYGLDVRCVGEVLSVEGLTRVPLSPSEVLGLYNLRGTALPVVDLVGVLELDSGARVERRGHETVLVLRFASGLTVGALIDRVETVVEVDEAQFEDTRALAEHPSIQSIVEAGPARELVSVLDVGFIENRLQTVRSGLRRNTET